MSEQQQKENLDWESMTDLVPMNLIDSDFAEVAPEPAPAVPSTPEPEATPKPGLEEKVEAKVENEADADVDVEARAEFAALVPESAMPGTDSEIMPRETVESLMAPLPDPNAPAPRVPSLSDTENFSRLQMEVAAQKLAEEEAQQKQAAEEEAQRLRLEQWMANARARLEKADENPTAPGRPPRVKRDPTPTMVRRAEMQRTLFSPGSGEETLADGVEPPPGFEGASGYRTGKIALDGIPDPMATIIVPRDTFIEPAADMKTGKLKAVERRVAQIRLAESGAETLVMTATRPEKPANLRLAVWVMAGLTTTILGLGIFALMETGYLESAKDLLPDFLSGRKTATLSSPAQTQRPEPVQSHPVPTTAQSATVAAPSPASVPDQMASVREPAKVIQPTPTKASAKTKSLPIPKTMPRSPAPVQSPRVKSSSPVVAAPSEGTPASPEVVAPVTDAAVAPVSAVNPPSHMSEFANTSQSKALANAEASMAGVEVAKPAFGNTSIHSTQGEAALKAMMKTVLKAEADPIQDIYNRFAKMIPGLSGDIVIGITVNPNGHILEGSVAASSTNVAQFDQEILRRILAWTLEEFPDNRPRYVAIPFHFEPQAPGTTP